MKARPTSAVWQALLLTLALLLCGTHYLPVSKADGTLPLDEYTIIALLDPGRLVVEGSMEVRHFNRANTPLSFLYFRIYPNAPAFQEFGGCLTVKRVLVDGVESEFAIEGSDATALRVALPRVLAPGGAVLVNITFEVRLPARPGRLGYYRGVFALGHWYPILAVYDERGWNLDPYWEEGESFYSECAFYDVTIMVPEGFVVAATGSLREFRDLGKLWVYRWRALKPLREFAWTSSKKYEVVKEEVKVEGSEVTAYSYFLPGHREGAEIALRTAAEALRVYSELFGPYPYRELRVAEVYAGFEGMEYPTLAMIAAHVYSAGPRELIELVVAHEVAHNWWYGIVGNHEGLEPFLDEALAEYSTMLYFERTYGEPAFERVFEKWARAPCYRYLEEGVDYPLSSSLFDFGGDSRAYFVTIYCKGAMVVHMLRHVIGDVKFFELLRRIQEEYAFGIITMEDFEAEASEVAGTDLCWFFDSWVRSSGLPSYRVEAVCERSTLLYDLRIVVVNEGAPLTAPVPVLVHTYRGDFQVKVWVNGSRGYARLLVPFEPVAVEVDPRDVIPGRDERGPVPVKRVYSPWLLRSAFVVLVLAVSVHHLKKHT